MHGKVSRKDGLDWITTHLYRNADRAMAQADFPASLVSFADTGLVIHDNFYQIVIRKQRVLNTSLKHVAKTYRNYFFNNTRGSPVEKLDAEVKQNSTICSIQLIYSSTNC